MSHRLTATALATVALASGCGGAEQRVWFDARELESSEPIAATVVADDGVVQVAEGTDGGLPCAQVTVMEVTTSCILVDAGRWGTSTRPLRIGDVRYIELRTGPDAREFVVWSTQSPQGRSIAPIHAAGNSILVWIVQPDEQPWGVQAIGPGGELGLAQSWVGLP